MYTSETSLACIGPRILFVDFFHSWHRCMALPRKTHCSELPRMLQHYVLYLNYLIRSIYSIVQLIRTERLCE